MKKKGNMRTIYRILRICLLAIACLLLFVVISVWHICCNMSMTTEEVKLAIDVTRETFRNTSYNVKTEQRLTYEEDDVEIENESISPFPSVKPMPLFEENDTLESIIEKMWHIEKTLINEYERFLIRKYAPLANLTDEKLMQQALKRYSSAKLSLDEKQKINQEINDFRRLWNHLMTVNSSDSHLLYDSTIIGGSLQTQGLEKFWSLNWKFTAARHMLANYQKMASEEEELVDGLRMRYTLTEEQREYLNHLITTKGLTTKDTGKLFCSPPPQSKENRGFINEIIKSNPEVKVPWKRE